MRFHAWVCSCDTTPSPASAQRASGFHARRCACRWQVASGTPPPLTGPRGRGPMLYGVCQIEPEIGEERKIGLQTAGILPARGVDRSNRSCPVRARFRFNKIRVVYGDTDAHQFVPTNGVNVLAVTEGLDHVIPPSAPIAEQIDQKEIRTKKRVLLRLETNSLEFKAKS